MNRLSRYSLVLAFFLINITIATSQNILVLVSGQIIPIDKMKLSLDRNSVEIFFKKESTIYKADRIDYLQIDNDEKYVSKHVAINSKFGYYLLRQIEEGQVNLLAYKDHVLFIQGADKSLEKLYYTRQDLTTGRIDTICKFIKEERSYIITNKYLTAIQNHLGPSLTVPNNLKLNEGSVKKVIRRLNQKFPNTHRNSFFDPLVAKRLYVGAIGIRNKVTNETEIAPQIGYELGINYKGMLTTGYVNFMHNPISDDAGKMGLFRYIQSNMSFGIRQYILKNSFIKPYLDFGIQNEALALQSGLLLKKSNFLMTVSINLKNGLLGTSTSNSSGIFQFNLGYQL